MSSEIEDKLFHAAYVAKNQDGTRAIDSDLREVKGWASRPLVDRDDELIEWDAWELDDFNLNPVMMLSHDYRKPPIAQVIWINKSEEGLMFKAKFPPEAKSATSDEIFNLYEAGVMKAFSVGFKPLEWVDSQEEGEPKRRYTKVNLLEISGVGIPALQTALVGAYQDGQIKDPALMTVIKGMLSKDSQDEVEFDDDEYIPKEIIEKPFENEHSCRLASPEDFDKFARKNCYLKHDEKCIDVVFGIKAGKSKIQAYRYPKDIWTTDAAKNHCKGKDGLFEAAKNAELQPEVDDFYQRLDLNPEVMEAFKQFEKWDAEHEKEGRVLSGKSRAAVKAAVDAASAAVEALNALLEATDTVQAGIDAGFTHITPDEALALLRLDAEEKAAAARLTADDMMREMQGRAD